MRGGWALNGMAKGPTKAIEPAGLLIRRGPGSTNGGSKAETELTCGIAPLPPGRCQRPDSMGVIPHVSSISPKKPPHSYHLFHWMVVSRADACFIGSVDVTGEAKKNGLDVVRDRLQVSSCIKRQGAIHGRIILVSVSGCLCEFMDAG